MYHPFYSLRNNHYSINCNKTFNICKKVSDIEYNSAEEKTIAFFSSLKLISTKYNNMD